tara:strand:+ start:2101 stop:2952 length:852 start_codon:yes stop_codon:yes gene_type:complete
MKFKIFKKCVNLIRPWFVFGSIMRPVIPFQVNLMYFKENLGKERQPNVGDLLSKIIFQFLLEYKGVKKLKLKKTIRFSFVGSVIQFLTGDSVIYGSGFLYENVINHFSSKNLKLDVRAVRGPNTKRLLEQSGYYVPEIYGDPAILLPIFYEPKIIRQTLKDFVVIPHWRKIEVYTKFKYPVLSPLTKDWASFIDEICNSKLVISASLHGLIIAEAYGVPAILLLDTEKNDLFKYEDYYLSTGRKVFSTATSVEEALKMEVPEVPDFKVMQKKLLEAFPLDIFV